MYVYERPATYDIMCVCVYTYATLGQLKEILQVGVHTVRFRIIGGQNLAAEQEQLPVIRHLHNWNVSN